MPLHGDFTKIKRSMIDQYGKTKGTEFYYRWVNKHGYDDTKPLSGQKSKANATGDDNAPLMELFDDQETDDAPQDSAPASPGTGEAPVSDQLDRKTDSNQYGAIPAAADQKDKTTLKQTLQKSDLPTNTTELDAEDLDRETQTVQPDILQEGIEDPNDKQGGGDTSPDNEDKLELQAKEQTTKERNELDDSQFAYPEGRKLPINDAAHVRNALARFNQTDLPAGVKGKVLAKICRAAKKFGIESDLCKEKGKAEASKKDGLPQFISVPSYRTPYTAAPKFGGKEGEILIKAIVLEEGANVNGWRVVPQEFSRVAEQYQAGRQLRVNHSKDMQDVIGKSYKGVVLKGEQVEQYMGAKIEGIDPKGLYVAAEFEANPADAQVRTNILQGYVETGSIGLDAEAFCDECMKPISIDGEGQMSRTCRHNDAPVQLRSVDVKEYSYVAEPAFSHSIAVPSFSAAINVLAENLARHQVSSLSPSAETKPIMSVEAAAKPPTKKAEGEGDAKIYSQSEADALADAKLAIYKQGVADAVKSLGKFRAEGEGEGKSEADAKADAEGKSEADAGKGFVPTRADAAAKTDQIGRVPIMTAPAGVDRN